MAEIAFVIGVVLVVVALFQGLAHSVFDAAPSIPVSFVFCGVVLVGLVVITR